MAQVLDEYRLEDIARDHSVGAAVFVPFAVARLRGEAGATEATLRVQLRNVSGTREAERVLHLSWLPGSGPVEPLAVQERTVTEWAACGIACAVISVYTGLRMRQVAAEGDRFDYWVDDGEREYGLEVSGTIMEDIEARHREKVRQLRENPYGADGYVVVVGFTTRHVICSFHQPGGSIR